MKSRKTNWTNNNAPVGKQNCRTKTNKSIGSTVFNELKTIHRFSRLLVHEYNTRLIVVVHGVT